MEEEVRCMLYCLQRGVMISENEAYAMQFLNAAEICLKEAEFQIRLANDLIAESKKLW